MGFISGDINSISGNLSVTGTLTVSGTSTLAALSATTGTFSSTLSVTGTSTLATVNGTVGSFSSTLTVTGATTLKSTLAVTGTSTLAALSATTGAFSSTLSVTGKGTFNGGATITGGLTVDSIVGSGTIGVTDPNNTAASVNLEFISDTPAIRYGGSGTGSANGFSVIGAGDVTKWSVDNSGNMTVYNNLVFANSINQITGLQKVYSAGGSGVTFYDKLIFNQSGETVKIVGSGTNINSYIAFYESDGTTRGGWVGYGSSTNNTMTIYNNVGSTNTKNNVLDDGSGNMTVAGSLTLNAVYATGSGESHFSNGTYSDPQSGYARGLKVSQGIATDYMYVSGAIHCESYLNNTGTYQVNSCPFIQMAYVTIPNNGSGGYKWTFPTAIPSSNGCQPLVTLNIVPGTQYFCNAGNNSRTGCTYYHSSSGSLSGWIFEVSQ